MTLRSVALDYINQKGLRPPKTLLKAIEEQRNRDGIVVTKPDGGSGVVVKDKSEYLCLPSEASINDTSKFSAVISKVLSKPIADSIRPEGSKLAHLYGLLKT